MTTKATEGWQAAQPNDPQKIARLVLRSWRNEMNEPTDKPGCQGCDGRDYHKASCKVGYQYTVGLSPVLDSERKDFGRMAQATAESLERARRMEAEGITEEDVWETRQNGAGLGD